MPLRAKRHSITGSPCELLGLQLSEVGKLKLKRGGARPLSWRYQTPLFGRSLLSFVLVLGGWAFVGSHLAVASLPANDVSLVSACQGRQGAALLAFGGHQQLVHCNTDFTGDDLAAIPALKAEYCFDLCRNFEACQAFTWSAFRGGTCWLKKGQGKHGVEAATGLYSAEVSYAQLSSVKPLPFCSGAMPILTVKFAKKPGADGKEVNGVGDLRASAKNCYGMPPRTHRQLPLRIKKRGSSSFYSDKSAFALELYADYSYQSKQKRALLGMRPSAEWILKANLYDRIQIKDLMAADLARASGGWAPSGVVVHVFWQVQGKVAEYAGLYSLMEKIERDPERLALAKNDSAGDISGAYIWQYNSCIRAGCADELLAGLRDVRMEYPKARKATAEQRAYLSSTIHEYWQLLRSDRNDLDGLINEESFARYFLHTELSYNVDAYWRSTWFYKKPQREGGQIYAGPVWDLDLAYGQTWDWSHKRPTWLAVEGWRFMEDWRWFKWAHGHGGEVNEYRALLRRPAFKTRVFELWKSLRAAAWSDAALRRRVQAYRQQMLSTSWGSHFSAAQHEAFRWPRHFSDATQHVHDFVAIEAWLIKRVHWMDKHLAEL